jgi:hypothetical protein
MLVIRNEEIEQFLRMQECIACLEEAYRDLGTRDAVDIPRQDMLVPNRREGAVHSFKTMSGSWPRAGVAALRLNSDIVSWPILNGGPRRVKSWLSLIVEVRPPPHIKATRMSMPQGSVIGTHHEIELVTPDVRAPSLSWRQIASCQTAATCCVAAGMPVGA